MKYCSTSFVFCLIHLAALSQSYVFEKVQPLKPTDQHSSEAYIIASLLNRLHYNQLTFSDSVSSEIFDGYFDLLDPRRIYFLEDDILSFENFRYRLDDQITKGEISFAFDVYNLFRSRVIDQLNDVFNSIHLEPDYTIDENYHLSLYRIAWQASHEQKNDLWRKIIKNQAVDYKNEGLSWNDISEIVSLRLRSIGNAVLSHNSDYVFCKYMNAISQVFDPSTKYFLSPEKGKFDSNLNPFLESGFDSLHYNGISNPFEFASKTYEVDLDNEGYKLGVITVPNFYLDFDALSAGRQEYESASNDVKKHLSALIEEGIDGLMLDLRFNGGGSLQEAIEMCGLFIPDGPVVQVRNYDQSLDTMDDEDGGVILYNGPLAILVNRGSAAASEVFCSAMQDYKRGVILGESTYGKGSIQSIIDLKKYLRNPKVNPGYLKITLAKLYRVNGQNFQRIGVIPDVQFPSIYSQEDFGEASRQNALPWDEIASAKFKPTNTISEELLDHLNTLYREDLNSDPDLQKLVRDIEKAKENRERKSVSLNLETRRAANEDDDDDLTTSIDDSEVSGADEIDEKLKKDPYLKEGLRLLAAMKKYKIG
ncbi:MAG: carboxy terminal-processing peptidase [Ekhidna sp.]|uniref:carboxy terminal-processing peptidase n=1 Tax=Ekhidna sp. TaxID=2608089 RepID=UPI0032ECDEC0